MPNNPRPPKRSWRDEGSPGKGHAPGRRKWQKEGEAKAPAGPRFGRGAKITLAAAALIAVGVGIWIVIEWLRPVRPFHLVLVGAGYEANLAVPQNVPGRRALADLDDWAKHYNDQWGGDKKKEIQVTLRDKLAAGSDPVAEAIKEQKKEQKESPTIVVYVTAHGAADADGAFFLPTNADPKKRGDFYRLSNVLGTLKTELKPETKKLLVLDTTGLPVSWPFGVLHNDFASALRREVEESGVENLVVLASCGDGQRSWETEDRRRSVFGRAVVEGLSGKAEDRGRVTAASLARYVEKEVHRWAWQNRKALQDPLLIDLKQSAEELVLVPKTDRVEELDSKPVPVESAPGLDKAWQERFELAVQTPPPDAYAPGLWRKYQDTLLRYEELLRSDDGQAAGQRKKELGDLKDAIEKARHVKADSLTNSLAMPAALGYGSEAKTASDVREQFKTLWQDSTKGKQDSKLAANESALGRLALQRFLIEKGQEKADGRDRKRAAKLLKELGEQSTSPRPAEAQFAVMLDLGLQSSVDENRVAKALAVRLRAEEAALGIESGKDPAGLAAYSEQVLPWIKDALKDADKKRRAGEDLLLAASRGEGPTDKLLSDADKNLQEAEKQYQALQEKARTIRAALAARDRALAELPYYTRWLARQNRLQALETRLAALWPSVHELAMLLGESNLNKLPTATKTVHDGMEDLKREFRAESAKNRSILQDDLQEIEDLLTVPFLEGKDRLLLLTRARQISADLARAEKDAGSSTDPKEWDRKARDAAKRQGRLALAVLGSDAPGLEPNEAGKRVADAFVRLAEEADKAPATKAAALQARRLAAVEAGDWLKTDPVSIYRGLLLRDLLVWQAERTFDDYWAAPPEDKNVSGDKRDPYFREAGKLYLADAAKAAGGTESEGGKTLGEKLMDEDKLKLVLDPRDQGRLKEGKLHVVHDEKEKDLTLRFQLATPKSMPEGLPVVWPRVEQGKGIHVPVEQRVPKVLAGREAIPYGLVPDRPDVEEKEAVSVPYVVSGYFRGREFDQPLEVRLHHRPDVTSYQPTPPEKGLIAVQADEKDLTEFAKVNTELVIVLDYSGSMKTPGPDGKKRIDKVLDALEQFMLEIPDGVTVSILTFSDRASGGNQIVPQFEQVAWSKAQFTRCKNTLRGLAPGGETPLIESIWKARKLFREDFPGNKTLIVLTDGGDSTFYTEAGRPLRRRGATIKEFLEKELKPLGILVYAVGFEIDEAKLEDYEKQGYKEFKPAIEAIGGKYFDVDNKRQLVKRLRDVFTLVPFWIEPDANYNRDNPGRRQFLPKVEGTIRRIGENPSPVQRDPGNHWAWVRSNKERGERQGVLDVRVNVRPGEALVLNLTRGADGRFGFGLDDYLHSAYFKRGGRIDLAPKPEGPKGWLMAVLHNQRGWDQTTGQGLRLMTTLENDEQLVSNRELNQRRPKFVWFEVAEAAKDAANKLRPMPGLRFYPLDFYPAPSYSLDLKKWPRDADPVLGAWWTEEQPPVVATLRRDQEFVNLDSLKGLAFKTDPVGNETPERVVVEDVRTEIRKVEVRPDELPRNQNCLVVRLSYPSGSRPYFVQLPDGVGAKGHEHRFYAEAGKYVGIFWDVSDEQAQKLPALHVVSVEGARQGPKAIAVKGMELRPPVPESRRPPALKAESDSRSRNTK